MELFRGLQSWLDKNYDQQSWTSDTSGKYRELIVSFIAENHLSVATIEALLHETHIYLTTGERLSRSVDSDSLIDLEFSVGSGAADNLIAMTLGDGEDWFFAAGAIAMVDAPLITLNDAHHRLLAEIEQ